MRQAGGSFRKFLMPLGEYPALRLIFVIQNQPFVRSHFLLSGTKRIRLLKRSLIQTQTQIQTRIQIILTTTTMMMNK